MSKDSTQRPRPDSNRGPFDPKSDAVTELTTAPPTFRSDVSEKALIFLKSGWHVLADFRLGILQNASLLQTVS